MPNTKDKTPARPMLLGGYSHGWTTKTRPGGSSTFRVLEAYISRVIASGSDDSQNDDEV